VTQPSAVIVTPDMLVGLPKPVRRYLEFSGVAGTPIVLTVTVRQTGRIRTGPEKAWMGFRATESYSVDPPGFVWNAIAGYGPVPLLSVRDSYVEGKGALTEFASLLHARRDINDPLGDSTEVASNRSQAQVSTRTGCPSRIGATAYRNGSVLGQS
jgi:hypothetical protein